MQILNSILTGVDYSYDGKYAFLRAVRENDLDTVKYLVEKKGVDVNSFLHSEDNLALPIAVRKGNIEMIKYLVEKGANVNKGLLEAIWYDRLDILDFLLRRGGDINYKQNKLLKLAIDYNRFDIVKYLIDHGANIQLALDHAYKMNRVHMVKYLTAIKGQRKFKNKKAREKTKKIVRARATDRVLAIKNKQYPRGMFPKDVARHIGEYLSFGKTKKPLTKALKTQAKKLNVRITVTRNGKRVYKSKSVLEKQIKNKLNKR